MNDPQPIATAPQNGTVILSNLGAVKYSEYHIYNPGWPSGWYECTPGGDTFGDDYSEHVTCIPTLWVPLPEWMN